MLYKIPKMKRVCASYLRGFSMLDIFGQGYFHLVVNSFGVRNEQDCLLAL